MLGFVAGRVIRYNLVKAVYFVCGVPIWSEMCFAFLLVLSRQSCVFAEFVSGIVWSERDVFVFLIGIIWLEFSGLLVLYFIFCEEVCIRLPDPGS